MIFSLVGIHWQWAAAVAIALCLAAGASFGAVTGFFIGKFKVQPFTATLAMMVFARGAAKWISGGQKVSTAVQQPDGTYQYVGIPEVFNVLNARVFGGNIMVVPLILLACILLSWVLLKTLRQGRYLYAVGDNE